MKPLHELSFNEASTANGLRIPGEDDLSLHVHSSPPPLSCMPASDPGVCVDPCPHLRLLVGRKPNNADCKGVTLHSNDFNAGEALKDTIMEPLRLVTQFHAATSSENSEQEHYVALGPDHRTNCTEAIGPDIVMDEAISFVAEPRKSFERGPAAFNGYLPAFQQSSTETLQALSNLTLKSGSDNHRTSNASNRSSISSSMAIEDKILGASSFETDGSPSKLSSDQKQEDWNMKKQQEYGQALSIKNDEIEGYRQAPHLIQRYHNNPEDKIEYSNMTAKWSDGTPSKYDVPAHCLHTSQPSVRATRAGCEHPCDGVSSADIPGYKLIKKIGKGGFSIVYKGIHIATELPVAIKIINKRRLRDAKERDRIDKEIRAMKHLSGHIAIVQLYEVVETDCFIYLIIEYFEGGTLLDLVRGSTRLAEPHASVLFRQILKALDYCHERKLVHRDVKLENLLLRSDGSLSLADFGLCTYFLNSNSRLKCYCGSPSYAAPEIVNRREYHATPVDVWSAGVVLFAMLCGFLPFHSRNRRVLCQLISKAEWVKPPKDISEEAIDLLQQMLTPNPDARITIKEALSHPWIAHADQCSPSSRAISPWPLIRHGCAEIDIKVAAAWAKLANQELCEILRALASKSYSHLTVGYHLLCEFNSH